MKLDCTQVTEALGEHATGTLRAQTEEEVQAHLLTCPVCSRKAAEMRATLTTLRALKPPTLPGGFDERLRARLEAAGPPEPAQPAPAAPPTPTFGGTVAAPRRGGLPLVVGGLVAAGAIAAALLLTSGGGPRTRTMPAASTSLSMAAPSNLLLSFHADAPHKGCEIRILAPPGVKLEGAGPGGELVLTKDLQAGDNEVAVTMHGEKVGSYRLVARARVGATELGQDIYVTVSP